MKTGQNPYWLSIVGTSGTGKTHIADKICDWFAADMTGTPFIERVNHISHYDVRMRKWSWVMQKLYAGEYEGLEETLKEWLLIIDDFGASHDPSKFGASKLLEIMERRQKKWTVFTCNLSVGQIASEMDTRIASRLLRNGSKVIEMTCRDFNLRSPPSPA